jgi:glutamate/tyrosine decarboxylase-like PLP-dependent enzyme
MTVTREPASQRREAPIDLDAETFRAAGHALIDQIASWLATMPEGPVTRDETSTAVREVLGAARGLPQSGAEPGALLSETADMLFRHSLFNGHPRFFGYITSSPAPIGALADLLASSINQNVGAWRLSPMATEIEAQTVRWIAELIGFPLDTGGLLVSGGNMANVVCLLAARAVGLPAVRNSGTRGLTGTPRVYASVDTHTWLQKAADMCGLGIEAIRWIPVDTGQRMSTKALEEQIVADRANGDLPFLVVATAGTVGTGAIDPLADIAAICRGHGVWFHVDGAYGALAARVAGAPSELSALGEADSIAVDPHKWLYAPLEAGCVLVRRAEHLRHAFSFDPNYYHFENEVTNYFQLGPQNSRGFRALKVWLALRQVGLSGYQQMIGDDMRLAQHLYELVRQHPDFEAMTQSLSITTFRYVPRDLRNRLGSAEADTYVEQLNRDLLTRVEQGGEAFLSNAVVAGRFALRACVVNFRTSVADIEALPPMLARLGAELDAARGEAV